MEIIKTIVTVLLVLSSFALIGTILLHKGKGGGVSDMFGGGMSASMRSSGVAGRNLNLITVGVAITWAVCVVLVGLMIKYL